MFKLDQAMAEWRRLMAKGRMNTPEYLDELESHLRDDVNEQMRQGSNPEQAFTAASSRLGKPAALRQEFGKLRGRTLQTVLSILRTPIWEPQLPYSRMKLAVMTLAGVPNQSVDESASQPAAPLDPAWATYFRVALLLGPALLVWATACVIVVPKLREVCLKAGLDVPAIFRRLLNAMYFSVDHWLILVSAIIGILVLLEWRSSRWPRYRRATMGIAAFLVNLAVLISISLIGILALVAASKLMVFVK